ncbi:MAG: GPP34 family phosphoprotein [Proteobacteria bacterium]|nr:GPP34 family phosphoprotein [Pseudomonadota bacterium]
MLTVAEEMLLLVLYDKSGTFITEPDININYALAGAVLADLALKGRIEADPDKLFVLDPKPTGDAVQDAVLARIAEADEVQDTAYWVAEIGQRGEEVREHLLSRLVERGILKRVEEKVLWVFETRRYPTIDGREEHEVKKRIMDTLLSEGTPSHKDAVIVSLADACSLFRQMLADRELENLRSRIESIADSETIGVAVGETILQVRASVAPMIMM